MAYILLDEEPKRVEECPFDNGENPNSFGYRHRCKLKDDGNGYCDAYSYLEKEERFSIGHCSFCKVLKIGEL